MLPWIKNALGISGAIGIIAITVAISGLCIALVNDIDGFPGLVAAYAKAAPKPGAIDSVATNLTAALPAAGKLTALVGSANNLLTVTASGIQQTTKNINRPCGEDGCGTLAQVDKTLVRVGDELTATQLEQRNVFPHVTAAMDSLKSTADGATSAAQAVAGVASDTHLKAILAHADGMSDSGDKILADAYKEEHKLLFPDKKKLGFWGSVYAGAVTIDHFLPPLF
jgi:hypothetical protein